jgi:hypothetical protein
MSFRVEISTVAGNAPSPGGKRLLIGKAVPFGEWELSRGRQKAVSKR